MIDDDRVTWGWRGWEACIDVWDEYNKSVIWGFLLKERGAAALTRSSEQRNAQQDY